jgi:hypothetical protein
MSTLDSDGRTTRLRLGLAGLLVAAGLGLVGWGTYLHLQLAGRLGAGACDGCSPWHPLFVVAPLVLGSGLLVTGGYVLVREDGD